jgi:response regulator RpfG family c-di-GMP phosphodiesterase
MKPKVLFVDDEANILEPFKLSLRKFFEVETALGPGAGLKAVAGQGPFPVVVSDLRMPRMDGIEFLAQVKELAPATVRIMLTGHADLEAAIAAVNKGEIFRFLIKPCPTDQLIASIKEAVRVHSLEMAERELLHGTLRGCLRVLTDILNLVNPEAFGRSERVHRLALNVGKRLFIKQPLNLDLGAMLSQLGCVTLPDELITKIYKGGTLSAEEQQIFDMHPAVTAGMLSQIPRMERVREVILHQNTKAAEASKIPLESKILKACLDYDSLEQAGLDKHDAVDTLRGRTGWYDSRVLDALEKATAGEEGYLRRELEYGELRPGMILVDPLMSRDNVHIMAKGTELTEVSLARLENFRKSKRLPYTVRVMVPVEHSGE